MTETETAPPITHPLMQYVSSRQYLPGSIKRAVEMLTTLTPTSTLWTVLHTAEVMEAALETASEQSDSGTRNDVLELGMYLTQDILTQVIPNVVGMDKAHADDSRRAALETIVSLAVIPFYKQCFCSESGISATARENFYSSFAPLFNPDGFTGFCMHLKTQLSGMLINAGVQDGNLLSKRPYWIVIALGRASDARLAHLLVTALVKMALESGRGLYDFAHLAFETPSAAVVIGAAAAAELVRILAAMATTLTLYNHMQVSMETCLKLQVCLSRMSLNSHRSRTIPLLSITADGKRFPSFFNYVAMFKDGIFLWAIEANEDEHVVEIAWSSLIVLNAISNLTYFTLEIATDSGSVSVTYDFEYYHDITEALEHWAPHLDLSQVFTMPVQFIDVPVLHSSQKAQIPLSRYAMDVTNTELASRIVVDKQSSRMAELRGQENSFPNDRASSSGDKSTGKAGTHGVVQSAPLIKAHHLARLVPNLTTDPSRLHTPPITPFHQKSPNALPRVLNRSSTVSKRRRPSPRHDAFQEKDDADWISPVKRRKPHYGRGSGVEDDEVEPRGYITRSAGRLKRG